MTQPLDTEFAQLAVELAVDEFGTAATWTPAPTAVSPGASTVTPATPVAVTMTAPLETTEALEGDSGETRRRTATAYLAAQGLSFTPRAPAHLVYPNHGSWVVVAVQPISAVDDVVGWEVSLEG